MRRGNPGRRSNSKEVRLAREHKQISRHTLDGGWICKFRRLRVDVFHEVPGCWTNLYPIRRGIGRRAKMKNRDKQCRPREVVVEEDSRQRKKAGTRSIPREEGSRRSPSKPEASLPGRPCGSPRSWFSCFACHVARESQRTRPTLIETPFSQSMRSSVNVS